MKFAIYLVTGIFFGIVLVKSEAASWFRVYEMFLFDSFHMYGIIGSAIAVGMLLIQFIKKSELKSVNGQKINIPAKEKTIWRYIFGGTIFGLGWALAGACPGPMFALLGAGYSPILITIISSILGTFLYGLVRHKLPH